MRWSLGPRPPLASRVPGPELGGPGPLAILRRSGAAGEDGPGGMGPRSLRRGGKWRQGGNPPYSPASKLTGFERFQFRPVSAQLRPICSAILPRLGSRALESLALLSRSSRRPWPRAPSPALDPGRVLAVPASL